MQYRTAKYSIIIFVSLTMLICSCSTVKLQNRKDLDIELDANSLDKLSAYYKNTSNDTTYARKSLYYGFDDDTLYKRDDLMVKIKPIDKKNIQFKIFDNGIAIDSISIKGKYKKGYFKVKRQLKTDFIVGPLLWILSENLKYIGLTNDNNLVVINSGGSGFLLFVVVPTFSAGGVPTAIEYERCE